MLTEVRSNPSSASKSLPATSTLTTAPSSTVAASSNAVGGSLHGSGLGRVKCSPLPLSSPLFLLLPDLTHKSEISETSATESSRRNVLTSSRNNSLSTPSISQKRLDRSLLEVIRIVLHCQSTSTTAGFASTRSGKKTTEDTTRRKARAATKRRRNIVSLFTPTTFTSLPHDHCRFPPCAED